MEEASDEIILQDIFEKFLSFNIDIKLIDSSTNVFKVSPFNPKYIQILLTICDDNSTVIDPDVLVALLNDFVVIYDDLDVTGFTSGSIQIPIILSIDEIANLIDSLI